MSTKVASLYAELGVKDLASNALQSINQALMKTFGQAGLVAGAFLTVGAGIATGLKKATDAAQEYDQSIKGFMAATGLGAEAASRLRETFDDAGVSSDKLSVALKMAQKKGIEPTIESIAKLSDQYLELAPGAERAQFLLEKFGRSGLDMARAMELGGDALIKMNGAVEDSLVLTDRAIKESEEYRINVDKLNDSWQGFKITVGNEVIPVLNDAIPVMKESTEAIKDQVKWWEYIVPPIAGAHTAIIEIGKATDNTTEIFDRGASMTAFYGQQVSGAFEISTEAAKEMTEQFSSLLDMTEALVGASDEQTARIVYNNLLQKLSVDGITQAEFEMANATGIALGIFDEKTATTAANVNFLTDQVIDGKISVQELGLAINGLTDKTITVTTVFQTIAAEGGANYGGSGLNKMPNKHAAGGPVNMGEMYMVGENGPELFVPNQNGNITPNSKTGNTTVNVYVSADYADPETIANRLKPAMTRVMREAGVV